MKATQRIRRSESQWAELIARFDASGLPATTFCQQQGIVYGTFTRRRRLAAGIGKSAASPPAADDWLSIDLAGGNDDLGHASSERTAADWDIELSLPGGVQLRLRARE